MVIKKEYQHDAKVLNKLSKTHAFVLNPSETNNLYIARYKVLNLKLVLDQKNKFFEYCRKNSATNWLNFKNVLLTINLTR